MTNNMSIKIAGWVYAPILIPTCNRIKHFSKCIESLNKNHNASETEVYISVDYPPNSAFEAGNAEIIDFLEKFRRESNFKKINVYVQKSNLGPDDNFSFLVEKIRDNYDYYIFTEDDNTFSDSFIDFCNYGLQKYEKNNEICFVCGYEDQIVSQKKWKEKMMVHRYYEPYGTACWIDKEKHFSQWLSMENIIKSAMDFRQMMNLRKYNRAVFNLLVMNVLVNPRYPYIDKNGNPKGIDIIKSFYLFVNHRFALFPSLNLVQNHGNDGSGVNTTRDTVPTREIQGEKIEFDFNELPHEEIGKREDRCSKRKWDFIKRQRASVEYVKWYLLMHFKNS